MKREILFRAKAIRSGDWVESMTIAKGTIKRKKDCIFFELSEGIFVGVIPETVGEYSAKLDIHKKRICEGDIVSLWSKLSPLIKSNYEVQFDGNEFTLIHAKREGDKYGVYTRAFNLYSDECEVIGNIHDNPELLK